MNNLSRTNKGFTLIEVVITLLILGLVFTMISTLTANALKFLSNEASQVESQERLRLLTVDVEKDIRFYVFLTEDGTPPNNTTDFKKSSSGDTITYLLGNQVTYVYNTAQQTVTRNGELISQGLESFSLTNEGSSIHISVSSLDERAMLNAIALSVYVRTGVGG